MHNIEILAGFLIGTCAAWLVAEWCLRLMLSRRQKRYPSEQSLSRSDKSGDQSRDGDDIRESYLCMTIKDALTVSEQLDRQTVAIHLKNALLSLGETRNSRERL